MAVTDERTSSGSEAVNSDRGNCVWRGVAWRAHHVLVERADALPPRVLVDALLAELPELILVVAAGPACGTTGWGASLGSGQAS